MVSMSADVSNFGGFFLHLASQCGCIGTSLRQGSLMWATMPMCSSDQTLRDLWGRRIRTDQDRFESQGCCNCLLNGVRKA